MKTNPQTRILLELVSLQSSILLTQRRWSISPYAGESAYPVPEVNLTVFGSSVKDHSFNVLYYSKRYDLYKAIPTNEHKMIAMTNLFWKTRQTTKSLIETPFNTEEEFETVVFETPEILEDVFLLKRQVRGGNKKGIPDIIGIDTDGNVCIIEMKNVVVDATIIPQVLEYAIWAESNPDSIKSLWLEYKNKPEDVSISWDSLAIRIILVAPSIMPSTVAHVDKITYQVDLLEVNRWIEGENHFLFVKKLEPEKKTSRIRPVTGSGPYYEDHYGKLFNKELAAHFIRFNNEIQEIVSENNWALDLKYNKTYSSFKAGIHNIFGIDWINSKTIAIWVKIKEEEANKFPVPFSKYSVAWKQANYFIDPLKTKTTDFIGIFEKAYKQRTGEL